MSSTVLEPGASWEDIPKFTKRPGYQVNVGWGYLETFLQGCTTEEGLDLDPDFQRAHVWTEKQQVAYVEYILRGGPTGRNLYFNCPGYQTRLTNRGPYVIVDGKQRLQAARRFMAGEILAFGLKVSEFTGTIRLSGPDFVWHVNNLEDRAEVLTWYLEMNTGGTPHTEEELDKVRRMLVLEQMKKEPGWYNDNPMGE